MRGHRQKMRKNSIQLRKTAKNRLKIKAAAEILAQENFQKWGNQLKRGTLTPLIEEHPLFSILYASNIWMWHPPPSRYTAVLLRRHCSNGVVGPDYSVSLQYGADSLCLLVITCFLSGVTKGMEKGAQNKGFSIYFFNLNIGQKHQIQPAGAPFSYPSPCLG